MSTTIRSIYGVPIEDTESREQIVNISEELEKLKQNPTSVSNIEPYGNDIPRIFINGDSLPTTKDSKTMEFEYYSKTNHYKGYVDIKCQGTSSMSYPKKNFTIKTYFDKEQTQKMNIDFLNWGKQNKFVLKANWIDISHARNIVSARLWGDVVRSREDYESLPELLLQSPNEGAIDGFAVKIFANGNYQGRYTLNIPKDGWMANMDKNLDNHCILCGENYISGCFRAPAYINGNDWSDELHDTVPVSIKTKWNEVISFVMNSSDEEFVSNISDYFNLNSLIDYLIYGIVSCGLDAFGKNQLYFTYDGGKKWIASMYDMDSTWGLYWNGQSFVAHTYNRMQFEDYVSTEATDGNLLYERILKLFMQELKDRYDQLRANVLNVNNIINRFEEFNDIYSLDLIEEDYATSTGDGTFVAIPSKTTNNIQQIRNYVTKRLSYCDRYFVNLNDDPEEDEDISTIPYTNISLENAKTDGTGFSIPIGNINLSEKTLFIDMNTTNTRPDIVLQDIISIGTKIISWAPTDTSFNIHVYYPMSSTALFPKIAIVGNGAVNMVQVYSGSLISANKRLKIAINSEGIFVNGTDIITINGLNSTFTNANSITNLTNVMSTFFNSASRSIPLEIGSMEGTNRSYITEYSSCKVYDKKLSTAQMLELTSIPQVSE